MKASHVITEALRGIRRNRGAYALSAAVQGICLVLLAVFLVLTFNLSALVKSAGRKVELYAFLKDDGYSAALEQRIRAIGGVESTVHVTKDDALAELKADLGEDGSLVEALGENPLPASIRVTINPAYATTAQLADIERKIALQAGVAEVWSGKEIIGRLNRIVQTVFLLDGVILVIVSCAVAFIVFQTVEGSIVSRRQEIAVMELVGASRSAVRLPFIIEGTTQGLLGGLGALVAVYLLYRFVSAVVPAPVFPVAVVVAACVGLGGLLGLAGSGMALNRIQQPHVTRGKRSGAEE
jgi:cell division transport system permease protein